MALTFRRPSTPAGSGQPIADGAPLPRTPLGPRTLRAETALVLLLSLGASAIWSVLSIVRKLTEQAALNQQTTTMNSSVTPDRPWLDLAYQLTGVLLGVVPALLALHLLQRDDNRAVRTVGALPRWRDALWGAGIAACIGIPGLGLYAAARGLGLNTTIAAANLADHWWTVPVLVLLAVQNAVLEEVVMVGYLLTRWRQSGWSWWPAVALSAVIRGGYHLYQGFGGFVGNIIMGLFFGWLYRRTGRLWPLVLAHALLDVVAFVGYSALHDRLSWL